MFKSIIARVLKLLPVCLDEGQLFLLSKAINRTVIMRTSANSPLKTDDLLYWDRQAVVWGNNHPPVRPSHEELQIFQKYLLNKPSYSRSLVLGSTPEMRDFMSDVRKHSEVYIADSSLSMMIEMYKFTKSVDCHHERWVKSDWLSLPFNKGFFDLIIGDVVLFQMLPTHEEQLLDKLSFLLADQGVIIMRLFFLDSLFLNEKFHVLMDKILRSNMSDSQKISAMKLQAVWHTADLAKRRYNRVEACSKYEAWANTKGKNEAISLVLHALKEDQYSYRTWTPPSKSHLIRILEERFEITQWKHADDYIGSNLFPIVVLSHKYCGQ